MTFACWSDHYATGHPEVDRQHQDLFRMINRLHESMTHGRGKELLAPLLTELVAYVHEHFATEEALMASLGYPGLAEHTQRHRELSEQVQELQLRLTRGYLTLPSTLSRFLMDWLKHHILEEDMAFIQWMKLPPTLDGPPASDPP